MPSLPPRRPLGKAPLCLLPLRSHRRPPPSEAEGDMLLQSLLQQPQPCLPLALGPWRPLPHSPGGGLVRSSLTPKLRGAKCPLAALAAAAVAA